MIKTLTACTSEIDDVNAAVSEILSQLDIKNNLLKNSVGIINCYSDFIEAGVVEALCKNLPFDIIGTTTLGNAVNCEIGQMMLSITVITSGDVFFAAGVTEPLLLDTFKEKLGGSFQQISSAHAGKPSMIIACAPLLFNIAGDYIVEALDSVSGSTPIFGTLAVDHTVDYSTAQTIFNGKAYSDALSMILVYGDINPEFFIASVSDEKILGQKAIITEAQGNILKGVNDMPVIDYLQSIGLAPNKKIEGLNAIPFIVDFNDGTKPVTRAIFAITPEGYAVCGGVMPVNATLGIGYIDHDEVLSSTKQSIAQAVKSEKNGGVLIYSCVVRNLALGFDVLAEMQSVQNDLKDKAPFYMSYSGGEICPVYNEEGKLVNRFHNDTIVICRF